MEERQNYPDPNQLSVLASTILLAYALAPFVKIPGGELSIQAPGLFLFFKIDVPTVVSAVGAALAAVGADWLLRSHPHLEGENTIQHWILPALTAWVISVPLNNLTFGLSWWAVFAFGGVLLMLVFVAEYVVVDFSDEHYTLASVGLTAVSFSLFLILAIALRAAGLRLYLLVPALVMATALVTLRTLYLRLNGRWCLTWTIGIAFIVGQIAAALHYWPLQPISFGLILLGPAYALTTLAGAVEEGRDLRSAWVEPVLMTVLLWLIAFWLGR